MKLLLCAATEMEIAETIHFLKTVSPASIEVVITGIGLTAATYAITKAIANYRPDYIIQAGIAGCLHHHLPLGAVVAVANETLGDVGVKESAGFQSLFDMKLLGADTFPWSQGKLLNNTGLIKEAGLAVVDGVSVNEITTDAERITYYRDQLKASVETMEGAALHYVALLEKVPFLQLRSLSNYVGERDKSKWMMGTAIAALNLELQQILSKFFIV